MLKPVAFKEKCYEIKCLSHIQQNLPVLAQFFIKFSRFAWMNNEKKVLLSNLSFTKHLAISVLI